MDQQDPERRIAELERRLSDAKATAGPTAETAQASRLTAADIRKVAFSQPPIGKRGYNEDEVDAFLDRVEARLLNPSATSLTAADVQNIAFSKPPIGKRGYNEDEVDAFLGLVESEISRIDSAPARAGAGHQHPPRTLPVMLANDGSATGRSRRSTGVGGWLAVIIVAGIWLYMFSDLVWDVYGYQVGMPTTATGVRCRGAAESDDPNVNCSGTWSIGGQSQQGPIHRVPGNWKSGQPLAVHVHGDTAFAAGSTGWRLGASLLIFVFVITMSLGGFRALTRRFRLWWTSRRR